MDTTKKIMAGLKGTKEPATKSRNEKALATTISAKLPMLERACEIRILDMQELRETTVGKNPVSPGTRWAMEKIEYSLPAQTAFIILPEENLGTDSVLKKGCLVGELTRGLFFVSGFEKQKAGGLWVPEPGDCEFLISPGKSVASFEKVLTRRFENTANIQKLLGIWGEGNILPLPNRKLNLVEAEQRMKSASDLLGDLHSVLMGAGNGEWLFAETQDSSNEKRIYELRKMNAGESAGGKIGNSEATRELHKAIKEIGTCTICSNPEITSGGILAMHEQPGGHVYALCRKCAEMDHVEKITLLERRINNGKWTPGAGDNLVQGNGTKH